MDCFSEGDKNTRYFRSLVKGRRKRIQIKRIKDATGNWLEDADRVAGEAVNFFHKTFTQEEVSEDSPILNHIPELITEEDNRLLAEQPTMEEVQKAVFQLNGDSTCGPDGFSGIFYQKCWEVIKADVFSVVKAFFEGQTLPKSITHTNLVLLPKKNVVESFSDMRPISHNNFINKFISRVVHDRVDKLLTRVISPNQSGFVKSWNIIENVLFTQEIVTDIRKRGKPSNVVIKLDMTKAYDRVSWLYLCKARGFFHSTRGVKQGDPVSPALFIIAAEDLSRALNSLFDQPGFVGYGMPKWRSLQGSVGIIRRKEDADIGHLGLICAFLNMKEVWVSGLFMTCPKPYVLHSGGSLEPLVLFGQISCGTNTIRSKFLKWFNGRELGALSYVVPQSWQINDHAEDVSELISNGRWDINKLMQLFPEDIFKVPIDEVVASIGIPIVSKCCCCHTAQIETINHLFLWGDLATKCNTDGAAKGNPRPSSTAFCIRNEEGDLVHAVAKILIDGSNIVAKAEAIRMGLMYCVEKELFPLIKETDSMTMKMIINGEWKIP
ncbi:uncharacterized protein LOC132607880 [Lycium barbarum]|uniref:uncharacterized protein LOC132607880 n=1 Tax=Lycium barbarum TaxID=112863 RepID=UPI00293F4A5B|nr:uncharacterized protein LOC132607880 [Lycium barbarum]